MAALELAMAALELGFVTKARVRRLLVRLEAWRTYLIRYPSVLALSVAESGQAAASPESARLPTVACAFERSSALYSGVLLRPCPGGAARVLSFSSMHAR